MTMSIEQAAINLAVAFCLSAAIGFERQWRNRRLPVGRLSEARQALTSQCLSPGRMRGERRVALWQQAAAIIAPVLTPHQRQEALARREAGKTLMDIARSYGVSHPTISRL